MTDVHDKSMRYFATLDPEQEQNASAQRNGTNDRRGRPKQADLVVALASSLELFHNPDGEAFARVPVGGHRETWALRSRAIRHWIAREFHRDHGKTPNAQALQDGLGVLEGRAVFDGPEQAVGTRLAEHEGRIYLDLGDTSWQCVEISPTDWRVVADPPVRFRRPRGMEALPVPQRGGTLEPLRGMLNVGSDDDWTLSVAWLIASLRPRGPFPILAVHGEQGSAKSTYARFQRALVDPNGAPLRAEPRDGRDLMIAATNGWVVALDNVSRLSGWLSDAICRLSTGGGFTTRELYSDNEEIIFEAQRPVILNGIEELATRGDTLDRSLVLYLPTIPEQRRRSERELRRDFDHAKPSILGALLDVTCSALRELDHVELDGFPRMADFAEWAVAAEPALGWTPGTFIAAYTGNRESANEISLEASPIVGPIRQLAVEGFEGTASELLSDLTAAVDDVVARSRAWPKGPGALSGALRRLAPNLRAVGVEVEFAREPDRQRRRLIRIQHARKASSEASASSSPPASSLADASDASDALLHSAPIEGLG